MKKTLSEILVADMLFICVLMLSGVFDSLISSLIYVLAFILPLSLIYLLWRKEKREFFSVSLSVTWEGVGLGFLFSAPLVMLAFCVSMLSSLLLNLISYDMPTQAIEGNIFYAVFLHALVPACLEELLFRYIPIKALGAHSLKGAVIYSSIIFAFSHCNLFQLPYAFISGIVLSVLVIITGSIWPSIIAHFVNNLVSILWQRSEKDGLFLTVFLSSLSALTLISIIFMIIKRKKLGLLISPILKDKTRFLLTLPLALYIIITTLFSFI